MMRSSYRDRDYAFGQSILALRTRIGLTQVGLAEQLGVSRKAVGEWEGGLNHPKAEHLQTLITLAVEQGAFSAGHDEEEIRAFWQAAQQKLPLDTEWLSALLPHTETSPISPSVKKAIGSTGGLAHHTGGGPRVDWDDALDVPSFYGRAWELKLLTDWVVEEHCRVVSVLGLGGIGKSALATTVMHRVAKHFEFVIWRSLRDAPACEELLDECLQVLAPQELHKGSTNLENRLSLFLKCLRQTRVLLVLDNLETLLEEGQGTGHMRADYEGYARLLRRLAETEHQSCLLLTSREKPSELVPLEGNHAPVRVLRLARLDAESCKQLLIEKDVEGTVSEQAQLIEAYTGNPLALKIVAQTIVELFDGEIAPFLEQGDIIFGGIRELLAQQFVRLSEVEQSILLWLAIVREPINMEQLQALLVTPLTRAQVLEAIEALHHRSLIERGQRPGSFTLQSVVQEYATALLIAVAAAEITRGQLVRLIEFGLELATVKEYVRQTQQRLIVSPLLAQVRTAYAGRDAMEGKLLALLDELRTRDDDIQGYGPANLLALLRELHGHLRGLDMSQLAIRSVFLQGVEMQDASLAQARLRETVFNEAFDIPWAVAISESGQYWAAGSRRGEVRLWREEGRILHLTWQAHTDTVRALAFSPDGHTLATGSWDGSIKLWNIKSETLLWTNWFTDNIECLAFAPDGRTLASGGDDAIVQLWDAHTGEHLQTLSDHSGPVFALSWSPDGRLLASGGIDRDIRLWELQGAQSETFVWALAGHTNWVLGLAFAPDGSTLASASWDRTVKLWDVKSRQVLQTLSGHTERVRALAWSSDGRLLASCGFDYTIWLWDSDQSGYRMGLRGHTAGVYDLAFTPDSHSLLSGSEDGTLRVWDVERGQCIHIMQGYAASLYDVSWSPESTRLASAGSNTLVTIWDGQGLLPSRQLPGHRSLVFGVAWSPDGRWLASCGDDGSVCLWEANDGQLRASLQGHSGRVMSVAWSPDGRLLASGGGGRGGSGELAIWEVSSGERLHVWSEPSAVVNALAWSPTEARLLSGSSDGNLRWWDTRKGECVRVQRGHQGAIQSLSMSPDGRWLASCGDDNVILLWDLQRSEQLRTLRHDRPYERLNITGIRGLSEAQKTTLRSLGAFEELILE
jgi:WD40 repeat protein/transcriptional regulator with XRE-family HTH domain